MTKTEKMPGRFSLEAIFKAVDGFKKPITKMGQRFYAAAKRGATPDQIERALLNAMKRERRAKRSAKKKARRRKG